MDNLGVVVYNAKKTNRQMQLEIALCNKLANMRKIYNHSKHGLAV